MKNKQIYITETVTHHLSVNEEREKIKLFSRRLINPIEGLGGGRGEGWKSYCQVMERSLGPLPPEDPLSPLGKGREEKRREGEKE